MFSWPRMAMVSVISSAKRASLACVRAFRYLTTVPVFALFEGSFGGGFGIALPLGSPKSKFDAANMVTYARAWNVQK
jgi:hypothetical protein